MLGDVNGVEVDDGGMVSVAVNQEAAQDIFNVVYAHPEMTEIEFYATILACARALEEAFQERVAALAALEQEEKGDV